MLFWHTKRLCWLGTEVEIQQGRCSNIQWCHWWIGQTVNHPKAEDLALASTQLLPCWDTGNFEQDWSPTVKWAIVLFLIDCCPWLTPCYHSAAINRNCLPVYAHTNLLAQDLLNFINSWHYHVFLQMLHLIDSNNIFFLHASGYDYCRCLVAFCRAVYRLFANLLQSQIGTNFYSIWRFRCFPILLRNDDMNIVILVS